MRKVSSRKRKEGSAQEKLEGLGVKGSSNTEGLGYGGGTGPVCLSRRSRTKQEAYAGDRKMQELYGLPEPRSFICQLADTVRH